MTYTTIDISEFLAITLPFNHLSLASRQQLAAKLQPLRYRMGQAISVGETMPAEIAILYEGQARLLGYPPQSPVPITLQLLKPGAIIGSTSLLRGMACETVIASTEATCLTLPTTNFLALLELEPTFADAFHQRCTLIEVFDLLGAEISRRALGEVDLKEVALKAKSEAVVLNLPPGRTALDSLDPNLVWIFSGGSSTNFAIGSRLITDNSQTYIKVEGPESARFIGFREPVTPQSVTSDSNPATTTATDIPYAPDRPSELKSKTVLGCLLSRL